jgi:hypothetical protein
VKIKENIKGNEEERTWNENFFQIFLSRQFAHFQCALTLNFGFIIFLRLLLIDIFTTYHLNWTLDDFKMDFCGAILFVELQISQCAYLPVVFLIAKGRGKRKANVAKNKKTC